MSFTLSSKVHDKTRILICQILWTLSLDFNGTIERSPDAPRELMDAMRARGVDIPDEMAFRMLLPHLDGGKYGKFIQRIVTSGRRTTQMKLVCDLPDESHLDVRAPQVPGDDNGSSKFAPQPGGDLKDAARGARDEHTICDETFDSEPASGPAGDCHTHHATVIVEFDHELARIDAEAAELFKPPDDGGEPLELVASVRSLLDRLELQVRSGQAAPPAVPEGDWLTEKAELIETTQGLRRRIKDAEDRLIERRKEVEGLRIQLSTVASERDRAERNTEALLRGESVNGHFRTVEQFIAQRPHQPVDKKPRRRTGGSSTPVYSVG